MKIGFIGLGIMGKPMCRNLMKAGYQCTVYNRSKKSMEELEKEGAEKADTAGDAAFDKDVVITMLPDSPEVREVVLGENGIGAAMKKGSILIDMSSISPIVSREIGDNLSRYGVEMLDAPVSGGEPKAIDGTLSIMVGGKREVFEQVKKLLLCMGSSAVYCGMLGAGNVTKLSNQIIVAMNITACAEAFTMAKKAGVDPECVFHAIRGGLAGSMVMDVKVPMMIEGNEKPGFRIDLHIKDLKNALNTAKELKMELPMTREIEKMFEQLHDDGWGNKDHSALIKFYEKITGISIRKQ